MSDQQTPRDGGDVPATSGSISQEAFRIRTWLRSRSVVNAIWPAFMLVMIAIMYFWLIVPSRGSSVEFDFKYAALIPLIVVGLVGWLIWDIYKVWRAFTFAVSVSEQGITVGDVSLAWSDVVSAEVKPAFGWSPAIILKRADGSTVEIPGGLEGVEYLGGIVSRKVIQKA